MFMHLLWCDSTCMPCCQNWPSFSSVSMSRRHSMRLLMIEKKCTWLHVEFTWVGHISLFIYLYLYIYIYTTFLPMELIVADSTSGLAACVARPLHWVSVVLLASPQHFFSRPLTEAPVSWRWRSPDQLAQHGWFFWFLLFRLRSLWSGGLRSCKQEGCKGYTPV